MSAYLWPNPNPDVGLYAKGRVALKQWEQLKQFVELNHKVLNNWDVIFFVLLFK